MSRLLQLRLVIGDGGPCLLASGKCVPLHVQAFQSRSFDFFVLLDAAPGPIVGLAWRSLLFHNDPALRHEFSAVLIAEFIRGVGRQKEALLSESIVPAIVIHRSSVGSGRQVVLSQSRKVPVARIGQTSGRSEIHSHHVRTALVAGPVDDHLSAGLADRARRIATVLRSVGQSLLLGGQD